MWYKIVDYRDGTYKTLFHGINRSKVLVFDEWLKADIKPVRDGTNGTVYNSGWHIMTSYDECVDYLKKFKNIEPKRIVMCDAKNIWPKGHSKENVFLSEYIYIHDNKLYSKAIR